MIDFKLEFSKLSLVSDGCFVLKLSPYSINLRYCAPPWIIDCVLFLDIHTQICVPQNINLICGFVLIFLCGFLSVSDNTDYL